MTIADIIARLEVATGPDREIDVLIAIATGYKVLGNVKHWLHEWEPGFVLGEREGCIRAAELASTEEWKTPEYTASIDAAITLVGQDWFVTLDRYIVSDEPNSLTWRSWLKFIHPTDQIEKHFAGAPTPALALCIAALKAKNAIIHERVR